MKFNDYNEYVKKATEFYSTRTDLKIPYELMILSEAMFNDFNGNINFGPGYECCNCGNENCCKTKTP